MQRNGEGNGRHIPFMPSNSCTRRAWAHVLPNDSADKSLIHMHWVHYTCNGIYMFTTHLEEQLLLYSQVTCFFFSQDAFVHMDPMTCSQYKVLYLDICICEGSEWQLLLLCPLDGI